MDLIEAGKGERADRYSLRIPETGLHAAARRRWRAGRIEAVHPVFRELGPSAALVHETLTGEPIRRAEVVRAAVLAPRTVDAALNVLAQHGLAERDPHTGRRRGPADLDRLAASLGVTELVAGLVARYRAERVVWRDLLERLGKRTLSPVPRPRVPDPILWPADLEAPPPLDVGEADYDQALAVVDTGQDVFADAIDVLHRELGATVLARTG